jgi:CO/xanthine dehydrogenase FAD-binding subunit
VKPPAFEYFAPRSLDEAIDLVARHGETGKLLAGGQSLVPLMNLRMAYPEQLIDLNGVGELDYVRAGDGGVAVGALTRQSTAQRELRKSAPLVAAALAHVGHFQNRNRGTVGGSIAHADPAAELPLVLLALGGRVTVRSKTGERTIQAHDLFESYFTTTLRADEILTEVFFPDASQWGFEEVSRRGGDFALVACAAVVRNGTALLAFGGVGATPVLVETATDAAAGAAESLTPSNDVHASAEYRRQVAGVLARRAVEQAKGR